MAFDIPDHSEDDLLDRFLATADQYGVPSPEVSRMLKEHPEMEEAAKRLMPTGDVERVAEVEEPVDRAPLAGGTTLGEFRIIRQINRGGMGIIYEALQTSLDRRVALKTILPHKVSDDARRRFERERQVLARLHESHIIPIYAAGTDDSHEGGLAYFAMPYIQGRSLRQGVESASTLEDFAELETIRDIGRNQRIHSDEQSGKDATSIDANRSTQLFSVPIDSECLGGSDNSGSRTQEANNRHSLRPRSKYLESVARFIRELAWSLQRVHELGVVHRDVTPANILIDIAGHGWLIDFGLAHLDNAGDSKSSETLAHADELIGASTIAGTPRYMAPEQFRGEAGPVTDVWGLGTALYELLTLKQFDGLKSDTNDDTSDYLQSISPQIPISLVSICRKALAPNIADRYASAAKLADDLTRWLNHEPVVARSHHLLERTALWSRRNPGKAITAIAMIIVCFASVQVMRSERRAAANRERVRMRDLDLMQSEAIAKIESAKAQASQDEASRSQREAKRLEKLANELQAESHVIAGDKAEGLGYFGKSWEMYMKALSLFERLAAVPLPVSLAVVGLSQKAPPPLTSIEASIDRFTDVSISSDRKTALLNSSTNACQLIDLPTGRTLKTFAKEVQRPVLCHALSPDGTIAATGSQDNTIRLWNVADGKLLHAWPKTTSPPTAIRFSGDGRRLVVGVGEIDQLGDGKPHGFSPRTGFPGPIVDGRILVWDVQTHKELANLQGHRGTVSALSVSFDGRYLVSGSHDMTVRFWDVDEAKVLKTFSCKSGPVFDVMLAPDARMAVAVSVGGKLLYCDLMGGQSQEAQYTMFNTATGLPMSAALLPDFSRILISTRDGNARLYGTPPQGPHAVLTGPGFGTSIGRVRFVDADVALTGSDGRLQLWGIRRNPFVRTLLPVNPVSDLRIFGEGRFAASLGSDRVVRLSCLTTGRVVRVFEGDAGTMPRVLAVNDAHQVLLTGGRQLKLWNTRTGRSIAELKGHKDDIRSVAISADGKLALSGSADGTARLWDLKTRKSLRVFNRHDPVDPRKKRFQITMVQVGSRFVRLPPDPNAANAPPAVDTVLFSPDGRRAFTKSDGAWIWDVASGRIVARLDGRSAELGNLWSFSSDGMLLLSWRRSRLGKQEVLVWNVETGKLDQAIPFPQANEEPVVALSFATDARSILALSGDSLVRVFDRTRGQEVLWRRIFPKNHQSTQLKYAIFSSHLKKLVVQDANGMTRVFDFQIVHQFQRLREHVEAAQQVLAKRPNDVRSLLMLADWYTRHQQYAWAIDLLKNAAANDTTAARNLLWCYVGRGRFRDGDWKKALDAWNKAQFPDDAPERRLEHLIRQDRSRLLDVSTAGGANSIVVASGDRKSFLVSGEKTQAFRLRLIKDRLDLRPAIGLNGGPLPVTGDGNTVLAQTVVGRSSRMALFDISREIAPARGRGLLPGTLPGRLRAMAISADGKTIAAGFDQGNIMIWVDNQVKHTIPAPGEHVSEARKVDPRLDKWLKRLEGVRETLPSAVSCLAFDETRNLLVVGYSISSSNQYPGYVQLIDTQAGKVLGKAFIAGSRVTAVAIAPDGKRLAVADWNGRVGVYSRKDDRLVAERTLNDHDGPVWTVDFSPDNSRLLSGGADHTIRIRDATGEKALATFAAHGGPVRSAVWTADSRRVISTSMDGRVYFWNTKGPGRK